MDISYGSDHQKQQILIQNSRIHQESSINQQEKQQQYSFPLIIDQANPILPPGYYSQPKNNTKYTYQFLNDKHKLNRTAFPDVKFKNWASHHYNNSQTSDLPSIQKGRSHDYHNQIPAQMNSQFKAILESRILLYKRINNNRCNQILGGGCKTRVYCSIFFANKNEQNQCGQNLIYEHLSSRQNQMDKTSKSYPFSVKNEQIVFNSAFQSGNLFTAFKAPQSNDKIPLYELYLQNDTNTKGCTQWFYFSVQNRMRGKIRFRIMNFYKPTSLFSQGMKVLCSKDQKQWKRTGTAINYGRFPVDQNKVTFCLQFIHDFDSLMDTTYFSYGYPFTYCELKSFVKQLTVQNERTRKLVKKEVLCQTNMGNPVFILTITENVSKISHKKPIIYIIARQHPGQTPASFIMQGLLNFLLSNKLEAQQLRAAFIFKIVPMVNIDGTINGNYRSNCSGHDVNRQWHAPSKKIHPQIYYLKKQIISNKKYVTFFLDIHAHSRKMNSFFYGNKSVNNQNKFYPFTCSKLCKYISYENSAFSDDPSKKTTGRVVIQTQLNLKNSLTFQCSFYGWQDKVKKLRHHFKIKDFQHIGQSLGLGIFYTEIGIKKTVSTFSEENSTKNTVLLNKQSSPQKNQTSAIKNSDKTRQAIWRNIQKNAQKIYSKWKKVQQYELSMQEQKYSQGSSIDPQHFQLHEQEQKQIQQMFQKQLEIIKSYQMNRKQEQKQRSFQRVGGQANSNLMRYPETKRARGLKNPQMFKSQNIDDKNMTKINAQWMHRGQAQSKLIPIGSGLRNSLVVKQLQSQLQTYKRKNQSHMNQILRMQQLGRRSQYKSLDPQMNNNIIGSNYRYNIVEMKKALKYFLQSKDTKNNDFQHYQNCFKTVQQNQSAVQFKQRITHRRIISKKN